ncbi:hypothetical protein M8542_36045 [Amycolatopsis sp. OK19-0408]|uniref:Uncharacterized protein n=1 Tax=Amycolatopsis iheyensis TaxID=2945988 RepID=A0A9X2NIW0_9PSEU|nr:hypothetical protein [Amycolatopsis iheyensis]MCR6488256.1 hypothetical protein [Amycolatopsis iheyensis]
MSGQQRDRTTEEPAEPGPLGVQPMNLWRAAYHHAEVIFGRFDRRAGLLPPGSVDQTERAVELVMLSFAITATTAAGIIPQARENVVNGPAVLADVSLTDLSRDHLAAGALFKEFLLITQGCEPRPGDPGYEVYVKLRRRMSVADSTAAAAFDDWERHCTALCRIVNAEILHQLTGDSANLGPDVTLAMLAGP